MTKKVTCTINYLDEKAGRGGLNNTIHKGFTIRNGKTLYWYVIWHRSGNCTVFRNASGKGMIKRYIHGDTEVTIHWKN